MISNDVRKNVMSMSREELRELWRVMQLRKDMLDTENAAKLALGDKVSFWDSKNSTLHVGEVVKINRKTAKVDVGQVCWKVPLNMLKIEG